jgi:hypothetical protein
MTRPRAADDFTVIRARIEELRRERAQATTVEERPEGGGAAPARPQQRLFTRLS